MDGGMHAHELINLCLLKVQDLKGRWQPLLYQGLGYQLLQQNQLRNPGAEEVQATERRDL